MNVRMKEKMTDAEIDALDSLALRKAVAEAVGWEIRGGGNQEEWICDKHAHQERFDMNRGLTWRDAIAACERAGMKINLVAQIEELRERYYEVSTPDEACRALLKAVAARDCPSERDVIR